MSCPRLINLLNSGKPAFGVWLQIQDPAVAEIAAFAGFDYVNIDLEHSTVDFATMENMIRAAQGSGISAMVRAPGNDPHALLRIAESGADGIYIPHVRDAADAKAAVMAVKYAPVGDRGISATNRAARYGVDGVDFQAYAERINRELIVWAQIEERSALDDVAAIASTEGITVVSAAPSDLARTLGLMGSKGHPEVGKAIRHVADTVRGVGKAKLGLPVAHPTFMMDASEVIALGAQGINVIIGDTRTLLSGFRENLRLVKEKLPS